MLVPSSRGSICNRANGGLSRPIGARRDAYSPSIHRRHLETRLTVFVVKGIPPGGWAEWVVFVIGHQRAPEGIVPTSHAAERLPQPLRIDLPAVRPHALEPRDARHARVRGRKERYIPVNHRRGDLSR